MKVYVFEKLATAYNEFDCDVFATKEEAMETFRKEVKNFEDGCPDAPEMRWTGPEGLVDAKAYDEDGMPLVFQVIEFELDS